MRTFDVSQQPTIFEALATARNSVAEALASGSLFGPTPDEEVLTWILLSTAARSTASLTVRTFTRSEESQLTGADWIWWWEGEPHQWFGCLVQAKRLQPETSGPTFDYSYTPRPSGTQPDPPSQLQRLLDAADVLSVPAAYVLYRAPDLGLPADWSCDYISIDWGTSAATFLPAELVNEWVSYPHLADDLSSVRPLECLACPFECETAVLAWYASRLADPETRRILRQPPTTPARRAFRALFIELARLRSTQLRGSSTGQRDQTHSGFAIGEHFARGMRTPPWYVDAVLQGAVVADDIPHGVAGVVVVHDR